MLANLDLFKVVLMFFIAQMPRHAVSDPGLGSARRVFGGSGELSALGLFPTAQNTNQRALLSRAVIPTLTAILPAPSNVLLASSGHCAV